MKKRVGGLLLAGIMLFLTACSGVPKDTQTIKPEEMQGEKKDVSLTLNIGAAVDFKNNPEAETLVAESLIMLSPVREVVPLLAKSWEHKDYREFVLKLPEDLKFNNGDAVTLEDFDRSLRILGKKNYVDFVDKLKMISMPDATTLKIELSESSLYFLEELVKVPIMKASAFDDEGTILEYIATGPYLLDTYETDVSAHLLQNPYYRNKDQYAVKEVNWTVLQEAEARKLALISGQVDVIGISEHWPSVSFADSKELGQEKNLASTQQNTQYYTIVKGFSMNWKNGPLQDTSLRRALMYAVDRKRMNETLFFGQAFPCGHLFNPMFKDGPKNHEEFSYDIEKAKAILSEAGYVLERDRLTKDGKPVVLRFSTINVPSAIDMGVFLKDSFQALGIELDIQTFEGKLLVEEFENGNFDIGGQYGWFEPLVTSIKFNGISSEYSDGGLGFGVTDAAIEAGKGILVAQTMEELQQKAADYWKQQYEYCTYLPLYHSGRFAFFHKDWEGFYFSGYGTIDLSKVRKVRE